MDVVALVVSIVAALAAGVSVWYARESAKAATRSADVAEIVERGRHYGWRIEPRTNGAGVRNYTLRNVGTVNARNVSLAGNYLRLATSEDESGITNIAAGQAQLLTVVQTFGDKGGEIHITWTPDLPGAEPMTWTEIPPMAPFIPPLKEIDWRNIAKAFEKLAERRY